MKKVLLSGQEFMADMPPPVYGCEPILYSGHAACLTAKTGHGKSTFTAMLVSGFLKARKCSHHIGHLKFNPVGDVLVLLGENSENAKCQLSAAFSKFGVSDDELDGLKVYDVRKPLIEAYAEIIADIRERKLGPFGFVLIDTSTAYFGGEDENSNVEMAKHASLCRRFTDDLLGRPTVLVNCHPSSNPHRSQMQPRGGGAFVNELDAALTLWNDDGLAEIDYTKMRGRPFDPFSVMLEPHEISYSDGSRSEVLAVEFITDSQHSNMRQEENNSMDTLLSAMRQHPASTLGQLATALGWSHRSGPNKQRVQRTIRRLEKAGRIKRDGDWWIVTEK